MSEKKFVYLTFPMIILKDGINDIKTSCNDAMYYSLYDKYRANEGENKNDKENAANKLGIKFVNIDKSFIKGKMLFNSINGNSPKTSISREMIFDFYENKKTEFEVVTFLAFAALKSIIQKQGYTKVTNEYLIGRMAGNCRKGEPLPDWIFKYNNRYQLDKIKKELQINWGLKLYADHTRGFYVSFKMPLDNLAAYAESKRIKYKEKQLREAKTEAKARALEGLKVRCKNVGIDYNEYVKSQLKTGPIDTQ